METGNCGNTPNMISLGSSEDADSFYLGSSEKGFDYKILPIVFGILSLIALIFILIVLGVRKH
ncbi:hypothetical protein COU53_02015 [Candidatus Pacearchaeota archaeon CG10_big_fil_rev_8_21_14_0_10_30_48]|nr:MAG: hypothetical protein COU53_02015 [Candidatus Pacearchaeota archaeon CG10_big_fil_rev_8_21_14_0_10_30_48]